MIIRVNLNRVMNYNMFMNRVLILGGGVGGLVAANELKTRLGDRVDVTLVDRKKVFEFAPSFIWLSFNERRPEHISKELALLKRKGIHVINDTVTKIDVGNRRVNTEYNEFEYDYDYLIIALGADYAYDIVKDFSYAHHNYS